MSLNSFLHLVRIVMLVCALLSACMAALAADEILPSSFKLEVPELADCRQLILVTAKDWDSVSARFACFERAETNAPWHPAFPAWDAVIGRNGLAWGIGLHGTHPKAGPVKREGDGRSPAGIFRLNEVFGYATPADAKIKLFPYCQLTKSHAGVDDSRSRYYNRVVDAATVTNKDWQSAEVMRREDDLYRWGAVVEHNWKPSPGFGSCIFLHVWAGPEIRTSGCTAMPLAQIESVVRWLDKTKNPLLVQLPLKEYDRLKKSWHLP